MLGELLPDNISAGVAVGLDSLGIPVQMLLAVGVSGKRQLQHTEGFGERVACGVPSFFLHEPGRDRKNQTKNETRSKKKKKEQWWPKPQTPCRRNQGPS